MKPADRSLEIVAIGLGQAGGNLAAEFQRRGYRALAFNTAKTDLSSLGASRLGLPDAQRIYIGLEGFDGAGSDADYGRECIAAHAETIRSAVAEHAAGADVVVLAAGLGGGTGSCAAEFTAILEEQGLPLVILTTLPHAHESGIAKVNALCGVRDLARTPAFGWALVDNARLARLHRDVPIDAYFETINREIVDPIDVFNRLNERDGFRAIRTLDGEDFRNLLLAGGILHYGAARLPKLDAEAVLEAVRKGLAESPVMPAGSDIADVAYLGLVIEAPERALAESPFSLYEEIAGQLKKETGGAAVYIGLYRRLAGEDSSTAVRLLATSHSLPGSIGEMLAEAEREAGTIEQKVQQSVEALDLGTLDRLRLSRRPAPRGGRPPGRAPASAASAQAQPAPRPGKPAAKPTPPRPMVKVEPAPAEATAKRAAAVASTVPAPAPAPEVARAPEAKSADQAREPSRAERAAPAAPASPPRAPATTKVEELRRIVASGPATEATTPAGPPPDPSRGRYERLANAFRQAPSDEKRLYIARELVAAQRSGEALERFYAVNAMARVDPAYFADALRNATRDADSHVADLARRALEKLASDD